MDTGGSVGGGNAAYTAAYNHFPQRPTGGSSGYLLFNSQPKSYDPMLKKIGEASAEAEAAGGTGKPLTATDEDDLRALVAILQDVSHYHSSRFQSVAPELIEQLVSPAGAVRKAKGWPAAGIFPAIDIARLMLCHPNGAERLAKLPTLLQALLGRAGEADAPEPVKLLVTRYAANLFMSKPGRALAKDHAMELTGLVKGVCTSANKNVRNGAATLLLNMAATTAAVGGAETVSAAAQTTCLELAVAMVSNASAVGEGDETTYRLLVAIGTLAVSSTGGKAAATQLGMKDLMARPEVQAAVGASSSKVKDCASELSRCLGGL
jgi:hypothetical protein